jgi:3-isopropylmalate dehydrogenase
LLEGVLTKDLGGTASLSEMTATIIDNLWWKKYYLGY